MDQSTSEVRMANWLTIAKQCQNRPNGQSARQWLAENGVPEKQYYYWLRKVKTAALQQAGFVEMPLPEVKPVPETDFTTQLVIKAAGNEIRINNDTPAELIARVLDVICHAQ